MLKERFLSNKLFYLPILSRIQMRCSNINILFIYFKYIQWLKFSLFLSRRIVKSRAEWIDIIRIYQTLNLDHRLYICDLHFDQKSLQRTNGKFILQKGAKPSVLYVFHLANIIYKTKLISICKIDIIDIYMVVSKL